jgi:omega-amidase
MQDLVVTIIQADLAWEDKAKNLSRFEAKLEALTELSDVVILPEMFSSGFTMNARQLAETADGSGVQWLQKMAALYNVDLVGSLIIREQDKFFNRLFWVKPDGALFRYDKRHLFRMAGEQEVYSAGTEHITVELKGWKIRPLICYDLRFPVWSRNQGGTDYDMLVYIANWPARRSQHWTTLLSARAIENQAYVVGVNRVGKDGNGIEHSGDSMVIDPAGQVLAHLRGREEVHTQRLSRQMLDHYRDKFPAWKDGDRFRIV